MARKTAQTEPTVKQEDILRIVHAEFWDPHSILGCHEVALNGKVVYAIRAFVPGARDLYIIPEGQTRKPIHMKKIHKDGFFEAILPKRTSRFRYRYRALDFEDRQWEFYDPYIFPPLLTDFDLHLAREGEDIYWMWFAEADAGS